MSVLNHGVIEGDNLDSLLKQGLELVENAPEVQSRLGDKTKEVLNTMFVLTNPKNRYMTSKSRKHNAIYQIAEAMWVLSGRGDLNYLTRFLPDAGAFSDNWDGKNGAWRCGYGVRIRHWVGSHSFNNQCERYKNTAGDWKVEVDINNLNLCEIDQLVNVINELKLNPNTRQAVISLWDPAVDGNYEQRSLDTACNNHLQFLLRDNKLHMIVTQRSSDSIWGFTNINVIEFTLMQEIVASVLGVELGEYCHRMGSFHIYDRHYDRAKEILDEYNSNFDFSKSENTIGLDKFESMKEVDDAFQLIRECEYKLRDAISFDNETKSKLNNLFDKLPKLASLFSLILLYKREEGKYEDAYGDVDFVRNKIKLFNLPEPLREKVTKYGISE